MGKNTKDASTSATIEGAGSGKSRLPRLDQDLADRLVAEAREAGGVAALTGPDGLLAGLVGQLLETALGVEFDDHMGYQPHERRPTGTTNARNGTTPKTVQTDVGPVDLAVPRDRDGSFDPVVVPKHARRLSGFDEQVLSLYAKGFTTGDIVDHVADIYGSAVSRDLVSRVTDAVVEEMTEWRNRPLDEVYPVVFIDALYVKIRDGQVSNHPIYVAMGINTTGERDVLGMWTGDGSEGAKQWGSYLTELRNRGVADVMIVCCDGLTGLPEAINQVWPLAQVQTCVVHLIRNSCKYVSRVDYKDLCADLRKVYTAPTVGAAEARWLEFDDTWGQKYPAVIGVWERAWEEFIPFLAHPPELRKIMYTTDEIVKRPDVERFLGCTGSDTIGEGSSFLAPGRVLRSGDGVKGGRQAVHQDRSEAEALDPVEHRRIIDCGEKGLIRPRILSERPHWRPTPARGFCGCQWATRTS